jgi:hypothetical protein
MPKTGYTLERKSPKTGYTLERKMPKTGYTLENIWQYGDQIIPIEVKAGTNSHLKSLHSFVNQSKHFVTAVRFWSGEFFVQDAQTPAPDNKPYRLINIPFYYIGQLHKILKMS